MSLSNAKSRPFGAGESSSEPSLASGSETEASGWLASSFDLKCGLDVCERPLDSLASDQLEVLIQQTVDRERRPRGVPTADQRRTQRRNSDRRG